MWSDNKAMKISEEELIQMATYFQYKSLPERWRFMERNFDIKEGDVVFDCGAYHGDMAYYFSKKVGETGTVLTFEPNPNCIPILYHNMVQLGMKNVILITMAVHNKLGLAKFFINNEWQNTGGINPNFAKFEIDSSYMQEVMTTTIDDTIKRYKLKKVNYMWFNIEANEEKAIIGAKETLLNNDVQLAISTHKLIGERNTIQDIMRVLNEYGYKCESIEKSSIYKGYK